MNNQTMMLFQSFVRLDFLSTLMSQHNFAGRYIAGIDLVQTTFLLEERGYGRKG